MPTWGTPHQLQPGDPHLTCQSAMVTHPKVFVHFFRLTLIFILAYPSSLVKLGLEI